MQHHRRRLRIAVSPFWLPGCNALALTSSGMSHTGKAQSLLLMATHVAVAAYNSLNAVDGVVGSKAWDRALVPVKLQRHGFHAGLEKFPDRWP